jgi:hypothetical protein
MPARNKKNVEVLLVTIWAKGATVGSAQRPSAAVAGTPPCRLPWPAAKMRNSALLSLGVYARDNPGPLPAREGRFHRTTGNDHRERWADTT